MKTGQKDTRFCSVARHAANASRVLDAAHFEFSEFNRMSGRVQQMPENLPVDGPFSHTKLLMDGKQRFRSHALG